MLEKIEIKEWLELNSKLQKKKNELRKALKEKGVLKNEGSNDYDNYEYFSEAQYKKLFTELFVDNKLELKSSVVGYSDFAGTEKQPYGRLVTFEFILIDIETGFYEISNITGEGIDKGDKGGYKASTGALKYYLANTFMVATEDDPENEKPEKEKPKKVTSTPLKKTSGATPKQLALIKDLFKEKKQELKEIMTNLKKVKIEQLTVAEASKIIDDTKGKKEDE